MCRHMLTPSLPAYMVMEWNGGRCIKLTVGAAELLRQKYPPTPCPALLAEYHRA